MTLVTHDEPSATAASARQEGKGLYSCFDFRLRSDLALPELTAAPHEDAREVVAVRLVSPKLIPQAVAGLEQEGDAALLTLPGVGRYHVRDGREIVIEPVPGVSERNLRLFLLGSALGILCHQRSLVPLHANAIVVEGRASAFAGASGAGKSTLAAHFARAGWTVLCDDVCAVGQDAEGQPWAWPGIARLKLWGDAAEAFGHDPSALDHVMDDMDKYQVPMRGPVATGPVPLARLYLLERAGPDRPPGVRRLRGAEALAAVVAHTYRGAYLPMLGASEAHFRRCVALASRIEVHVATRAWGFDQFDAQAQMLLDHMRADISSR